MSIEPYTWDTLNGCKISIALEEIGLTDTVPPSEHFSKASRPTRPF